MNVLEEDPIKNEGARVFTTFPHYNPMGAIRCHGHQSSDPIHGCARVRSDNARVSTSALSHVHVHEPSDLYHYNQPMSSLS